MKVVIATDVRIISVGNRYYQRNAFCAILQRYWQAFGKIVLYARVEKEESIDRTLIDVTEYIDKVLPAGFSGALIKTQRKTLADEIRKADLAILRAPSFAAVAGQKECERCGCPYLAEAMGDAWDMYWNHGFKGKTVAVYMTLKTKEIFRKANYAVYVTERYLEEKYPCGCAYINASNVKIPVPDESVLALKKQQYEQSGRSEVTIMTTAAVYVRYKGQEYVIRALRRLREKGIKVRYYLVGGGDAAYLKRVAEEEHVSDCVEFVGEVTKDEVLNRLDGIELYIQPSLQEGLPRSVIEAMSRGCICIGARTAGIPELLEERYIVRRKSVSDIVDRIEEYVRSSADEKCRAAARNFEEARKYYPDILDERRNSYYARICKELRQT